MACGCQIIFYKYIWAGLTTVSLAYDWYYIPYRCGIIHGDVKPHNILLDFGYNALLGDMDHGIELPEDATHVTATNAVGTLGYKDRYRTEGDQIRVSEDLFSLGIGLFCWKFVIYT